MTELIDKTALLGRKTEAQVRNELLALASALADKAKTATSAEDARTYAESAAVVFDAARIRSITDPIPDGG